MSSYLRTGLVAVLLAASITLGACGGSDNDNSSDSSASGVPTSIAESAKKDLSATGTFTKAPTQPVKPPKGKRLMLLSCGQAISACQFDTAGAAEAAKVLGWESTIYDTKGDPTNSAIGIRQAIAGKYDGIFMYFMDCNNATTALKEARKAGIPVVAAEAFDCNQIDPGAPSLFTYSVHYTEGDYNAHARAWGRSIADYAIWKQDGKSKALTFADDTALGNKPIIAGQKEEYAKCGGCSLDVVRFPFSAFGTSLQSIAEQQLVKHPDVNTVLSTYEAISLEVEPAVAASGRKILTFVGEGGSPGTELVREKNDMYGNGWPLDWEGWAVVDALARIFVGQKPVATGMGVQTFNKDHNTPESGRYVSPIDYQSMYKKLWGLE